MKIIKIISEWKKLPSRTSMEKNRTEMFYKPLSIGKKMVQAIVEIDGQILTKHIAIPR